MLHFNIFDTIKPYLRSLKYAWLQHLAEYKVQEKRLRYHPNRYQSSPIFIIGCGRSGTTILGHILSLHPDVCYLFEPYHLWAAVDPMTDMLNFFHRINAHFFMNESHATVEIIKRFNVLFMNYCHSCKRKKILVEKTPVNTVRIGYLNAIAPTSKFIHIVRDGIDVSFSIDKLASSDPYRITSRPNFNTWWGVDNYKWKALRRDGKVAGYYTEEVDQLHDYCSRGAYEWLVSLGEVNRWRNQLGNRIYEIKYDQLITNPKAVLMNICEFLELEIPNTWIKKAITEIRPSKKNTHKILSLPQSMLESFNTYQNNYDFSSQAIPFQ